MVLVEDEQAVLEFLSQALDQSGYDTIRFASGEAAVSAIQEKEPDLVVLDVMLPDIDGFEVLERLRADPSTAHIPVLALSANAMAATIERGNQAGFHRYLTKPVNIKAFMEALEETLHVSDDYPNVPTQPVS